MPPLWRESRFWAERLALQRRSGLARRGRAPGRRRRGPADRRLPRGRPVARRRWPRGSSASATSPSAPACARTSIARRARPIASRSASASCTPQTGRRVAIVGQSRGGSLARLLAHRAPDAIAGIVTLGSPLMDELAVHPWVKLHVRAVATLGDARRPRAVLPRVRTASAARIRASWSPRTSPRRRLRLGLLAQRRHRRLALVPAPGRRERAGQRQPLRHVGPRRHLPRRRARPLGSARAEVWRAPPRGRRAPPDSLHREGTHLRRVGAVAGVDVDPARARPRSWPLLS